MYNVSEIEQVIDDLILILILIEVIIIDDNVMIIEGDIIINKNKQ